MPLNLRARMFGGASSTTTATTAAATTATSKGHTPTPVPSPAMDAAQLSRVCDRVVELLSSPYWRTPIDSFIDDHCYEFDTSDEASHHQADTHREFVTVVESMLDECLSAMGITHSGFLSACTKIMADATHDTGRRETVLALLACDDFAAFRNWMVARNLALEAEALKAIQHLQQQHKHQQIQSSASMSEEDMLALALAMSLRESEVDAVEAQREEAELALAISLSLALSAQQEATATATAPTEEGDTSQVPHEESKEVSSSHTAAATASKCMHAPSSLPAIKGRPKPSVPILPSRADTASPAQSAVETELTEVELAARRKFFREQRALIIAKKKRDGEQEVKDWQQHESPPSNQSSAPSTARWELIEALRLAEARRRGES